MKNNLHSHLALSDDGFLFDSSLGNTYTLNSTGTLILKKLINGDSHDRIMAALTNVYDVSGQIVSRDMNQFFQYLQELEIIDTIPEESTHEE